MSADDWNCETCAETTSTARYCAPTRCYCGHPACHAFGSWVDLRASRTAAPVAPRGSRGSAWDNREDSTWIDKL